MIIDTRKQKGIEIAKTGNQIKRIDENSYKVKSQTGNGEYDVISTENDCFCSCYDHVYRHVKCKHSWAVETSLALCKPVSPSVVIQPINALMCQHCDSNKVVKNALRHNKYGNIQRYLCKSCNKRFSVNLGFEKMKANPQTITNAMQLYFTGESLRNVTKFLRLQGINVSHVTIYRWIEKYTGLMQKYLEQITPQVSDTWRADELWIKINGNMKYLFAMIDDQTRYWLAQEVADTKHTHDVRNLFVKSREVAGKKPMTLITDGLHSYKEGYMREYWTQHYPRTQHIHFAFIKGKHDNNKMERFNGEVRDRTKVMRGLKKPNTSIITGYQIFHNYFRSHEGLKGKTPAEIAGIKIEGDNKWITLIQNASQKN